MLDEEYIDEEMLDEAINAVSDACVGMPVEVVVVSALVVAMSALEDSFEGNQVDAEFLGMINRFHAGFLELMSNHGYNLNPNSIQ